MKHLPDIAFFLSFSGDGGVERMMLNLAEALVRSGWAVDLVRARVAGGHTTVPEGVRVIDLGTAHTRTAVRPLARYLRHKRPHALLAAKDRGNRVAVLARERAQVDTRVVVRLGTHLSKSLQGRSRIRRGLRFRLTRRFYPRADAIVAVSSGVAADIARITELPRGSIHIIPNPVVTPQLHKQAGISPDHPWLSEEREAPVLLAVGRLTRQKDFPTLLRAFARLRSQQPARLVILGEGPDRSALERLAGELGVTGYLDMPGFQSNPYPYMARADLFVLSSAWEGSPNAMTEALALGTPVVATDCPSGPKDLLAWGQYGPLVPIGDDKALAEAMARVLAEPHSAETLREAAIPFDADSSAQAYLSVMGLAPPRQGDRLA